MKHCPATDEQIEDLQDDLIATMPTDTHFKIDQLCAQARSFNEPCTDAKEMGHGCLRAVKAENELAAAQADAARYRWLRHEHDVDLPLGRCSWKMNSSRRESCWVNIIDGNDLDAAIDAAMKEMK